MGKMMGGASYSLQQESPIDLTFHKVTPPNEAVQKLYFDLLRTPWTVLVVVPTERGLSGRFVARALVNVGTLYGAKSIHLLDAEAVSLVDVHSLTESLSHLSGQGALTIIVVDCPRANPAAMALVRLAGAALLVVPIGDGSLAAVKETAAAVGLDRVVGCVALSPARMRA